MYINNGVIHYNNKKTATSGTILKSKNVSITAPQTHNVFKINKGRNKGH